jgi:hypothetical protein
MEKDYKAIEEKAHSLLAEQDYTEAYKLFKEAGNHHRNKKAYKEASICFASAASCWSIKSGEKTFFESAVLYDLAAKEAEKCFDFEYASLLYKHAAINYERDREFLNFSDSFYNSKETMRRFLLLSLVRTKKTEHIVRGDEVSGVTGSVRAFILWLMLTMSWLVWGHGERPWRTLGTSLLITVACASLYSLGLVVNNGRLIHPSFFEALYMSSITMATVGYGDYTPFGPLRIVAMIEAFCGIIILPLFLVGLARKYLRE